MKKRKKDRVRCEPCNKIIHADMLDAIETALRLSRATGKGIRIYDCPAEAGRFHITRKRLGEFPAARTEGPGVPGRGGAQPPLVDDRGRGS